MTSALEGVVLLAVRRTLQWYKPPALLVNAGLWLRSVDRSVVYADPDRTPHGLLHQPVTGNDTPLTESHISNTLASLAISIQEYWVKLLQSPTYCLASFLPGMVGVRQGLSYTRHDVHNFSRWENLQSTKWQTISQAAKTLFHRCEWDYTGLEATQSSQVRKHLVLTGSWQYF